METGSPGCRRRGWGVEWGEEGPEEDGGDLQPFDPVLTAEGPKAGRVMPVKNHGGYSVRMVTLEGKISWAPTVYSIFFGFCYRG